MIKTIHIIPPQITQFFDSCLLDPLLRILRIVENKVIPLSKRKIRNQDIGKQREFKNLLVKFYEVYERKKIEKEEYNTKIKNASERPSISNASST